MIKVSSLRTRLTSAALTEGDVPFSDIVLPTQARNASIKPFTQPDSSFLHDFKPSDSSS